MGRVRVGVMEIVPAALALALARPRPSEPPTPTLTLARTWSAESILSNSSMQQIPLSASINAPASTQNSPVSWSLPIDAVKPAADEALPLV